MNSQSIIQDVKNQAGEWLEMTDKKDELISIILANKIIVLNQYIQFLEKMAGYNDYTRSK